MNVSNQTRYSVVIPVYNGARYIRRAVESALAQDAPGGEVIVVDDGSIDESGAIARSIDPSVVVLRHDRNQGQSAARNTGIQHARGEFIVLLDSDDWWSSSKVGKQLTLFDARQQLVAVFSDFSSVDVEGNRVGWQGGILEQLPKLGVSLELFKAGYYVLGGPVLEALILHTSFIHSSTIMIRRSAFDRVGMFSLQQQRYYEDLEMWLRITQAGPIGFIAENLTTIESRPDSMGHRVIPMLENGTQLYSELPIRFPNLSPKVIRHIRRFLQDRHARLGEQYRQIGQWEKALYRFRTSLHFGWSPRVVLELARTYLLRGHAE
jgi:hypothetical protein